MTRFKDEDFSDNETVDIDDHEFVECRFNGTTLVYRGTGPVTITGCSFDAPTLVFSEGAGLAVDFIAAWASIKGNEGWLDILFEQIRSMAEQRRAQASTH